MRREAQSVALPIATQEVHPSVRTGGIALQDLLDQAHGLDVLAPIERRAQAQAGDRIGHRHLVGCLPLMFIANCRLRGHLLRRQVLLDGRADRRELNAVLADSMQELDDRGDAEG